jgi:hypothetical protein
MRKTFFVLAAVACCACSKGVVDSSAVKEEKEVELKFCVPVTASKMSGPVTEDAVENLQVFVFGKNGEIQTSAMAEGNTLAMTCTTGDKDIAVVVNSSPINNVSDYEGLVRSMSDFGENASGHFVMTGSCSEYLDASGTIEVPVSRRVSKVILSSVTRAFTMEQHKNMDFELMSVFLTNVSNRYGFFQELQSDELINEGESDMDAIIEASGELLYDDLGNLPIEQDETVDVGNFLYCYPNFHEDGSIALPYLVVQARLGDGVYFYSAELPGMKCNKCYNVSLTVTMPGSLTPDLPVKKEEASFSVVVSDWDGNVDVDETI